VQSFEERNNSLKQITLNGGCSWRSKLNVREGVKLNGLGEFYVVSLAKLSIKGSQPTKSLLVLPYAYQNYRKPATLEFGDVLVL